MVKHSFNINSCIYVIHVIAQISSTWPKKRAYTSLNHMAPRLPPLNMHKLDIAYYVLHISQSSYVQAGASPSAKYAWDHVGELTCNMPPFNIFNLFERKKITVLITNKKGWVHIQHVKVQSCSKFYRYYVTEIIQRRKQLIYLSPMQQVELNYNMSPFKIHIFRQFPTAESAAT